MTIAIIGVDTFSVVVILSILLVCGLPLDESTIGGRYKVFPKEFKIVLVFQLVLQMFFITIILQMGGIVPLWFFQSIAKIIYVIMAAYLSLNTVMSCILKNKKEKVVVIPLLLISAICFWATTLQKTVLLEFAEGSS